VAFLRRRPNDSLRCSFCGKSQNKVKKLIAGPTVYICNECVDICNEIITDDQLGRVDDHPIDQEEQNVVAREHLASSTEHIACPACDTPLALNLKPLSSEQIEFPSAPPPQAKGEPTLSEHESRERGTDP